MKYKLMVLFVVGIALSFTPQAQVFESKSPKTYIVKEGDTLWELSASLLDDPMLWPRLWENMIQKNQSAQSPHLIYPGDQLTLRWIKGSPQLTYKRKIKLSPNSTSPLTSQGKVTSVSIIPSTSFADFLSEDLIMNPKQIQTMPRLVSINSTKTRFINDDIFYVEGQFEQNKKYGVYRLGNSFKDLLTGEALGTELLFIGYSKTLNETNNIKMYLGQAVTTHRFIKSIKEAVAGDLVVPIIEPEALPNKLVPQLVSNHIEGYIVSIKHNAVEAAQWNTVLINKGIRDNIELGSLFSVLQSKPNRLTGKIIGELMVIKSYEKVSVAVVLHAKKAMRVDDKIQGRLKKD